MGEETGGGDASLNLSPAIPTFPHKGGMNTHVYIARILLIITSPQGERVPASAKWTLKAPNE